MGVHGVKFAFEASKRGSTPHTPSGSTSNGETSGSDPDDSEFDSRRAYKYTAVYIVHTMIKMFCAVG